MSFRKYYSEFFISSDWTHEHKEANATWRCVSMVGFLCCLQGERKRCRFVNVTGRFPISLNFIREHKETNATIGGAPMAGCLCCLQSKIKRCRFVNVLPSDRKKKVSFR